MHDLSFIMPAHSPLPLINCLFNRVVPQLMQQRRHHLLRTRIRIRKRMGTTRLPASCFRLSARRMWVLRLRS